MNKQDACQNTISLLFNDLGGRNYSLSVNILTDVELLEGRTGYCQSRGGWARGLLTSESRNGIVSQPVSCVASTEDVLPWRLHRHRTTLLF